MTLTITYGTFRGRSRLLRTDRCEGITADVARGIIKFRSVSTMSAASQRIDLASEQKRGPLALIDLSSPSPCNLNATGV
jgi:hypothetical protein